MRAQLKFCPILWLLVFATAGRCQAPASDYSLTIRLPESTVKVGAFVRLEITIKNISDHEINVGTIVGSAESGYDITVLDDAGKPAIETSYGRKIRGKEPRGKLLDLHSEMLVQLQPGETTQDEIYLSKIFDFTRPGKYSVQVTNTIYARDADGKAEPKTKTVVKSNSVVLTVAKQ